jgi:hypothetical protein
VVRAFSSLSIRGSEGAVDGVATTASQLSPGGTTSIAAAARACSGASPPLATIRGARRAPGPTPERALRTKPIPASIPAPHPILCRAAPAHAKKHHQPGSNTFDGKLLTAARRSGWAGAPRPRRGIAPGQVGRSSHRLSPGGRATPAASRKPLDAAYPPPAAPATVVLTRW